VYDAPLVDVSTSNAFVFMLRTATEYEVVPLDGVQLSVTFVLLRSGPGLLAVPGVGLSGVTGIATGALGVAVAKLLGGPCPAEFTALTM
jgi:hypothetical protein